MLEAQTLLDKADECFIDEQNNNIRITYRDRSIAGEVASALTEHGHPFSVDVDSQNMEWTFHSSTMQPLHTLTITLTGVYQP